MSERRNSFDGRKWKKTGGSVRMQVGQGMRRDGAGLRGEACREGIDFSITLIAKGNLSVDVNRRINQFSQVSIAAVPGSLLDQLKQWFVGEEQTVVLD